MKDRCAPDKKTRKELDERVVGALQYSMRNTIENYKIAIENINEIFKNIGFKFSRNTLYYVSGKGKQKIKNYIDKLTFFDNEGVERPLSDLMSRKEMRVYDFIDSNDLEILSLYANKAQQAFADLNKKIGVRAVEALSERWREACDNRRRWVRQYGNFMDELNGVYKSKMDPNANYKISTDPLDIILKSTARTWESMNCERIYGSSDRGIDSDIAHNAAVVYLRDSRKKGFHSVVARLELKMCEYNPDAEETKDRFSVGFEINWYRGNRSHARHHIFREDRMYPLSIRAVDATKEVIDIIKSKGFYMDYEKCVTPYEYAGFSDIEYGNNKKIRFQGKWKYRCYRCGTPVRNAIGNFPEWNRVCPYHNQHPEAPDVEYDENNDEEE